MTDEEKTAIKAAFPTHYFMRILKDGWQATLAVPTTQSTPTKQAAVELWHKATAKLDG